MATPLDVALPATGPALVPVLQQTGLAELVWSALVAAALVVCA